jgi:hypothetical protein
MFRIQGVQGSRIKVTYLSVKTYKEDAGKLNPLNPRILESSNPFDKVL